MNKIRVDMPIDDWVWLCELLAQILKEGELDAYTQEDTKRVLRLLESAEHGVAVS